MPVHRIGTAILVISVVKIWPHRYQADHQQFMFLRDGCMATDLCGSRLANSHGQRVYVTSGVCDVHDAIAERWRALAVRTHKKVMRSDPSACWELPFGHLRGAVGREESVACNEWPDEKTAVGFLILVPSVSPCLCIESHEPVVRVTEEQ